MAKLEYTLFGSFDSILNELHRGIMSGSVSASYEDGSDFYCENCRCAVRVYERYSMIGGNRVSLSLTLFEGSGSVRLSAISSGGSQAMIFKLNTFGEQAFLDCVRSIVDGYLR